MAANGGTATQRTGASTPQASKASKAVPCCLCKRSVFRVLSRASTPQARKVLYTKSRLLAYEANYLHTSNAVKASKVLYTKARLLLHEANYLHTSAPL